MNNTHDIAPHIADDLVLAHADFQFLLSCVRPPEHLTGDQEEQHRLKYVWLVVTSMRMSHEELLDMRRSRNWEVYDRMDEEAQIDYQYWEMYQFLQKQRSPTLLTTGAVYRAARTWRNRFIHNRKHTLS